jgi:hypothetical protein
VIALGLCALTVVVAPARLQIGPGKPSARVSVIGVQPKKSKVAHVRLWTSLGNVSEARDGARGDVEATYTPPAAGPPTYAVIGAWDDDTGEVAVATVELEASTEIPVETEPAARVIVTVANHRVTTHADTRGRAAAMVLVPPGVSRARVTAQDAAGNITVAEVPLDIPPPDRVWLVERAPPTADKAQLYAFTLAPDVPDVSTPGSSARTTVSTHPGVAVVKVTGNGDVTLVARVGTFEARHQLKFSVEAPRPPPVGVAVAVAVEAPKFADPRDDLGASIGVRFADLVAASAGVEWRRRIRRSRFHVGVDFAGLYAEGTAPTAQVRLGGVTARVVGEARLFPPTMRITVTLGVGLGAAVVGEHRVPVSGASYSAADGGPSVGAQAGLLAKLGPGVLTLTAGFYYTPLLGIGNTNLEGGLISVGYRWMRF